MQTTPAADDITAAVKKTLTSSAFIKFMEQAVHTAVAALQAAPAAVVLPGVATLKLNWSDCDDYISYECTSTDGTRYVRMQCGREPSGSIPSGIWYGREVRTAADGSEWSRSLGFMVHDDFGFLVEVAK